LQILAADRNFKITQNDIIKISINCQNLPVIFLQLIKTSNNGILGFFKVLINWIDQVKFDQLTKKNKKNFD
jgi:hypothetical protein